MQKFLLLSLWLIIFNANAQTNKNIIVKILSEVDNKPVVNAKITINTKVLYSDYNGLAFTEMNTSERNYILVEAKDYDLYTSVAQIQNDTLIVKLNNGNLNNEMYLLDINKVDVNDEVDGSKQNSATILNANGNLFQNITSYGLGQGGFRQRGYGNDGEVLLINGMTVNNIDDNGSNYYILSGLNDVVKDRSSSQGLSYTASSFGNIGGTDDINLKASSIRKQRKISYAKSNRTYSDKVSATYSSGLTLNNWAYVVSGSVRLGSEGYVKGTFNNGMSGFLGVEKRLKKHSFGINIFNVYTKTALRAPSVEETYVMLDDKYYNSNWGYQNGEIRNAKIRENINPTCIINHSFDINKTTKLSSSFGYLSSIQRKTALNWYNAPDPRPDYYRYLPSYQTDNSIKADVESNWINEVNNHQINWDKLYQVNYLSNTEGKEAKYIIENQRVENKNISFNSTLNTEIKPNIIVDANFSYNYFVNHCFKTIEDLLGANYWLDVDQYAEQDFAGDSIRKINNINSSDYKAKEGEVFGYDYENHIRKYNAWTQAKIQLNKTQLFIASQLAYTKLWRNGLMKNGRYPDNSYGQSDIMTFLSPSVKGGLLYKINRKHYIEANAGFFNKAPSIDNALLTPKIRNKFIEDLNNQKIISEEFTYNFKTEQLNTSLTFFNTSFKDLTDVRTFYHDDYKTYVNMTLSGIDKTHRGIEFASKIKINYNINLTFATAIGQYFFNSRPNAVISLENGAMPDTSHLIYIKNYNIANTPMQSAIIGINYKHSKNYYLSANLSYFGEKYVDIYPERRTEGAITNIGEYNSITEKILNQEKIEKYYICDASIGKTFTFKNIFTSINFSVSNIFDNQNIIAFAFEQSRFDFDNQNADKFPAKYMYSYGRTFFFNISFSF